MINDRTCQIYVGTSGFSYDDWESVVYPGSSGFDKVAFLASFIDAIEINTSFYRPVSPRMVESWISRTRHRADFLFCFKLHRQFTHERSRPYSSTELRSYLAGIEPARQGDKLGAVLAQFPFSMHFTQESVDWLMRLADDLADYPLAIEVRHGGWDNDRFYQFLRDRRIAFCNIDQPQLRNCLAPTQIATTDFAYVRLHGRNAANWFSAAVPSDRYNYLYSENELQQWVKRIGQIKQHTSRIFVFANNHFVGKATANAIQLRYMFLQKRVPAPPLLVKNFPQLQQICTTETDTRQADSYRQGNLFDM